MNRRFKAGQPSGTIAASGVLLRQFDRLDDKNRPWLPCPLKGPDNWCASLSDRWASSIVNTQARHLYLSDKGGVVVDAESVRMLCACAEDCNSQSKVCDTLYGDESCIPGCSPPDKQCFAGRAYDCSFPPTQLKEALLAQQSRDSYKNRNNEMVLDTRSVVAGMPNSIDGFFYLSTKPGGAEYMRGVQRKFAATYGLSAERTPPLMELEFTGGAISGDQPFKQIS